MIEENEDFQKMSISSVCGGALVEMADLAIQKVIAHLLDQNTDHKKNNEVNIKIKMRPHSQERKTLLCEVEVKETLAGQYAAQGQAYIADGQAIVQKPVEQLSIEFRGKKRLVEEVENG